MDRPTSSSRLTETKDLPDAVPMLWLVGKMTKKEAVDVALVQGLDKARYGKASG